jgi:hypothetical protein
MARDSNWLDQFPAIPQPFQPNRELVFERLTPAEIETLTQRGYKPIILLWLPRTTPSEEVEYLRRFMQGVTEGTVVIDKVRLEGLWFEMKSRGLLDKSAGLTVRVAASAGELRDLLDWKETQHRIGVTTMVAPEKVAAFLEKVSTAKMEDDAPTNTIPRKRRRKRA